MRGRGERRVDLSESEVGLVPWRVPGSQSYTMRPCLNNKQTNRKKKGRQKQNPGIAQAWEMIENQMTGPCGEPVKAPRTNFQL